MLAVSWFAIDWTDEGAGEYPGGVILRDAAGQIARVALGPGDVDCRPFYAASQDDWIVKAIVASEDGDFFDHCGVRLSSIARAVWQNVTSRRRISGASTITMQTVRLISPHRKTYFQKWLEAFRALKMEREKDKLWIITQYLNRAPFGANFIGIESAAGGWFGKSAKTLTLCEAAMLAGMVQAPSRFRPDRRYERALKRRDYVLDRMVKMGYATREQAEAARAVRPRVVRTPRPFKYPHYCDYFMRTLPVASGDYVMPLDPDIQDMAQKLVDTASEDGGFDVAMIVRRTDTGDVAALAVSGDYFSPGAGQVNTALAPRSAGSTLKPFLAALAMDRGIVSPSERLIDVPSVYKGYNPANFDSKWRGLVTLDDSLVLSLNIPFVHLLEKVRVDAFGDVLRSAGFALKARGDQDLGLGMAVGNVEVTLEELTGAYAQFARAAKAKSGGGFLFSPESAYLVSKALSGGQRPGVATGHIAECRLPRFAWKTGTSSAYRDAWTVAWNPEFVIGVWCGHISGKIGDKALVGAQSAAPLVWNAVRLLYPRGEGPWFSEPEGVFRRKVCALSGLVPNVDCPVREDGFAIRGVTTAKLCRMHRRDGHGKVTEELPRHLEAFLNRLEKAKALALAKPADGVVFTLVPGMSQQKIVCKVSGNPDGQKLWWFLNGKPCGESSGDENFAIDMQKGEHLITCSTAEGVSASVNVEVK